MYRRYSQTGEGAVSSSRRFRNRLKNLLIIILLLALIALSVWAIPALRDRESNKATLIQRIQTECGAAIRQTSRRAPALRPRPEDGHFPEVGRRLPVHVTEALGKIA